MIDALRDALITALGLLDRGRERDAVELLRRVLDAVQAQEKAEASLGPVRPEDV